MGEIARPGSGPFDGGLAFAEQTVQFPTSGRNSVGPASGN